MSETLPTRFDRFEVQGFLGEGTTATVYRAFDPSIKRTVAIKVLKEKFANDSDYHQRFLHEARAVGHVSDHPNIATIYDVGEQSDIPFITMECAGNDSLDKHLQQGPLPVKRTIDIAMKIAAALNYAHHCGVVHRDIKPSNIICCDHSDDIRITDFGIASIRNVVDDQQQDWLMGSPHYMSPEQISGQGSIDHRSDIFSLGVVLYEMLAGRLPFQGKDLESLTEAICSQQHTPLESSENLPEALLVIIDRCLAKAPEQRFNSVDDLLKALIQLQKTEGQGTRGLRWLGTSFEWRWVAMMLPVIIIASSIGAYILHQQQQQRMQQLALEYGLNMGELLASQSAEALLLSNEGDRLRLTNIIEQFQQKGVFSYITMTDHKGAVRASTAPRDSSETAYLGLSTLSKQAADQRIAPSEDPFTLFDVQLPIAIHNKIAGYAYIGIAAQPLQKVPSLRSAVLANSLFILLGAIALLLWISYRLCRTIKQLQAGMEAFKHFNLSYRLPRQQGGSHWLNVLVDAFNQMGEALSQQVEKLTLEPLVNPASSESPSSAELVETPNLVGSDILENKATVIVRRTSNAEATATDEDNKTDKPKEQATAEESL